jgi:hypothetical protein
MFVTIPADPFGSASIAYCKCSSIPEQESSALASLMACRKALPAGSKGSVSLDVVFKCDAKSNRKLALGALNFIKPKPESTE